VRVFLIAVGLSALAGCATAQAAPPGVTKALGEARAPLGELRPALTVTLSGGATIHRYRQRVAGTPVLDAGTVVNDPAGTPPALVGDSTHESIRAPAAPSIDRSRAIELARSRRSVAALRADPSAHLAIRPGGGGTLVWVVHLASGRPLGDFEVLVNARTGVVLATRDLLERFQTGKAKLYDPNPVAEQGSYAGLNTDHNGQSTNRLDDLRRRVTLEGLDDGQSCLHGQWATAKVDRAHRDVCRASLDWRGVTRSRDKFEALMAYYHIDRAQRYVQSLDVGQPINERSTTALADGIREDNSFFSPFTRKITYGAGGVDDAEDADVIIHEYGHAIQDAQLHGGWGGNAGSAMGEGFGDYMAVTMSEESPASTTKGPALPDPTEAAVCVFDWDGVSYSPTKPPCGRRTGIPKGLDDLRSNCTFDPHCVGKVWSSALWDLRNTLGTDDYGRVVIDRDLLASHFLIGTRSPSFKQGGQALLDADQDLYGGANVPAIQAELQSRDIL
jgi:hypothetical protein